MAIKICCTEEDGKHNYGRDYCSMENLVKFGQIITFGEGYGYKADDNLSVIIYNCPFCGAKITDVEEEKEEITIRKEQFDRLTKENREYCDFLYKINDAIKELGI